MTMDETWLDHYDPETKQHSMEWRHSGSPRPKKFRVQKSAGKVLASIFWNQDGILLTDYLPKSQTINAEYYISLLVQLKEQRHSKVTKAVLFLHNNAPAHRALATQKNLAYLGFKCLDHPSYCPDLALSDYHPFPRLKKTIERSAFFSLPRRLVWTDKGLIFFLSGLQKLEQRAKKWIELRGEYVE